MSCPYVWHGDEGTSGCSLANVTGKEWQAMKARLEIAVEALRWYADCDNYSHDGKVLADASTPHSNVPLVDGGYRAGEALAKISKADS